MTEIQDNIEETHSLHNHNHNHISSSATTTKMSNFPRDLLKRFLAATTNHHHHHSHQQLPMPGLKMDQHAVEEEAEQELELTLGLSTNGRFGVDPIAAAKKIKRTTSMIPEFVNQARDEEMGYRVMPVAAYGGGGSGVGGGGALARTCSLPTENAEEWRQRKEIQTLRRMEARRKRWEKQRNMKALRERNHRGSSSEAVEGAGALNRTVSLTTRVGGLGLNEKEKGNGLMMLPPSPPSIGSSHGTGSSGTSEAESQHGQGPTPMDTTSPIGDNLKDGELKSPASGGARVTENSGKIAAVPMRSPANRHPPLHNRSEDTVQNMLEDMPSVSAKGEGPDGKKVDGFLYQYAKGEEVRILCVCHGLFLSPAEFVRHAGGPEVANPLKHIVVSPSSL